MSSKDPVFSAPDEVSAIPNGSSSPRFRQAHDELIGLQALARAELAKIFERPGLHFDWSLFVSVPTPYKHIKDGETAKEFIQAKVRPSIKKG